MKSFNELTARVLLSMVASVGDAQLHDQLKLKSATQIVRELLTSQSTLQRKSTYLKRLPQDPLREVHDALAITDGVGARVVTPSDPLWPSALNDLGPTAPYCLWMRGPLELAHQDSGCRIAIVGARAATHYGVHVAGELAAELVAMDCVVVSGGAFGIDAAAHHGALAADGGTVAVMAHGIDQIYPTGNATLLQRVMETGVAVSELPPGIRPTRQGFLARNRLIAALSAGTVVVEAALRSGSASTVTRAGELGREVMAVPGPVTSAMSVGTHALLRDGATLVTCAEHILEALSPIQLSI
jgi:DNA processing protein